MNTFDARKRKTALKVEGARGQARGSIAARALNAIPDWATSLLSPSDDLLFIAEAAELLSEAGIDVSTRAGFEAVLSAARRKQTLAARPAADALASRALGPRRSWVYYLVNGTRIKIGYSVNPRQRCASMGDYIAAVEPGDRMVERRRHRQFDHLRVAGEWFEFAPDLLAHVESLRVAHDIPAHLDARGKPRAKGLPPGQMYATEIAAKFNLNPITVRSWTYRGPLKRTPEGGILVSELVEFLARREGLDPKSRRAGLLLSPNGKACRTVQPAQKPRHADQLAFPLDALGM